MPNSFYDEAAKEIIRDVADKKRQEVSPMDAFERPPSAVPAQAPTQPEQPTRSQSQPSATAPIPEQAPVPVPVPDLNQIRQEPVVEDYSGDGDDYDDFDFVEAYDDDPVGDDERMLSDNTAASAIKCAFLGIGGGGGKLAKAFLDLGFNKTLLINTTVKDQPRGSTC